jgi:hypothetical protein
MVRHICFVGLGQYHDERPLFYHQNFKFPIVFEALGHSQGLSGILRHIYNTMILKKLAYFKRPNRLVHHLLDLDI